MLQRSYDTLNNKNYINYCPNQNLTTSYERAQHLTVSKILSN